MQSRTVVAVGAIWDEQKILGKVRACVKGRVAGDGGVKMARDG